MMSLHMKVSRLAMELEDKVFGKRTRGSDKLARQVEEMDHLLSTSQLALSKIVYTKCDKAPPTSSSPS